MNLTNFLKQTDAITAQYSAEQLISFIHNIGRILPEYRREDFLERLKAIGGEKEQESAKETEGKLEFYEKYEYIKKNLTQINSQEIMLEAILNEEYDDWYDDNGEEFYYVDKSGILVMLEEACYFVHTCMDRERYKEGYEIGNQLFLLEMLCESEYDSWDFSLGDMAYQELLQCDMMQLILDTAYYAYHAVSSHERPEIVYKVIANAGRNETTLEAIMQHGDEELPDFQEFLTRWITYLGIVSAHDADRLILEAVGLLNDFSVAVKYAGEYAAFHPALYLNILENETCTDADEMVAVGMEALNRIPKNYIMRSRVALKTAEYVIKTNEKSSLLEECYFAAYESDTSAINYLRVLLNGYETVEKRRELQKVFAKIPNFGIDGWQHSERAENRPDHNMILLLRFLDGQFADVLAQGLNRSEALGWSGTFMKQGIALYLLTLYKGQWTGKGIMEMAVRVKSAMKFSAEEYCKGSYGRNNINENDLFFDIFAKWRSAVHMEPDIRTRAIKRIASLLEKRVEGIMGANRRNYYGECAAFLAALGEVQESLGEAEAKQKLMTSYKDKYPRRSAFRAEMKFYGWLDRK